MISRRLRWSAPFLVLSSVIAFAVELDDLSHLPAPLSDASFLGDGAPDDAVFELGRNLFFDPILSGNQNISCGTCHDPALGSGDGLEAMLRHHLDPLDSLDRFDATATA